MNIRQGRPYLYVFLFSFTFFFISSPPDIKGGVNYFNRPTSSRVRILISVAAHTSPDRPISFDYLTLLLHEYEVNYAAGGYIIHVHIDTNSAKLAEILATREPIQSTREIKMWTVDELGGDPEYLPHMHRKYWEEKEEDFDFFIFTEDDILFPREAFEMYVDSRQALQANGWIFGWVRVEKWGVDNETLVAIDIAESRAIKTVFETPDGLLWAEPLSPYTAHYVLDRSELRKMIEDTSHVWITGFPAIDTRANVAMGYNYKFSGNQESNPFGARGWQSRALVPISGDCKVKQPGGIVRHLPSKYAKSTTLITNNDCIYGGPERKNWGSGSNLNCKYGQIALSRVFLCHNVEPKQLPLWPEGASLN